MENRIIKILMDRDGITKYQAERKVEKALDALRESLKEGEMPENICMEYFGLEPDYLEDLILAL